MSRFPAAVVAVAALIFPGVAAAGSSPVPRQFCQVQLVAGGPVYSGVGMSVTTPSGNSLSVCRVAVPPPPETIVTTFHGGQGGQVVITRSGAAIVVFH